MNLNKVFLLGRVATPPEIRNTPSGQSVCTFTLATNRVWKDANGQKRRFSISPNCFMATFGSNLLLSF